MCSNVQSTFHMCLKNCDSVYEAHARLAHMACAVRAVQADRIWFISGRNPYRFETGS